jgi:hypothetical protein
LPRKFAPSVPANIRTVLRLTAPAGTIDVPSFVLLTLVRPRLLGCYAVRRDPQGALPTAGGTQSSRPRTARPPTIPANRTWAPARTLAVSGIPSRTDARVEPDGSSRQRKVTPRRSTAPRDIALYRESRPACPATAATDDRITHSHRQQNPNPRITLNVNRFHYDRVGPRFDTNDHDDTPTNPSQRPFPPPIRTTTTIDEDSLKRSGRIWSDREE